MKTISTFAFLIAAAGCGSSGSTSADATDVVESPETDILADAETVADTGAGADAETDAEPDSQDAIDTGESPSETTVKRCEYSNAFTGEPECKQYIGTDWTAESGQIDCDLNIPGGGGMFFEDGTLCDVDPMLGRCDVDTVLGLEYFILLGGNDPANCAGGELGCEAFASGTFTGEPVCDEEEVEDTHTVFIWPYEMCDEPIESEAPGASEDGEVCVWEAISGCVEEGRDFRDYGSCDIVETNRPYYPVEGRETGGADDPRMDDAEYRVELDWVQGQLESCACICCHSEETRDGPAIWSVDGPILWPDMMSDQAIGMFAGYVDSSALGAYLAEENNGFDRTASAMATTDVERMLTFWLGEFDRRGLTADDMGDYLPVGSALLDQVNYEMEACEDGDGVAADGTLVWSDTRAARYLYVLEAGSDNPGLPPNFDMPEGVMWRVDVPHTEDGFDSGVTYRVAPGASIQIVPAEGVAPAALVSGQQYHLYVLFDVALPIARCIFTAP
ncbi:MAG: hypothetical protein ACJAYU_004005 [Bradymonadia bacterium]|jgi:hypothetical protein